MLSVQPRPRSVTPIPVMTRVRRPLILAALAAGAIVQHILVSAPPEPTPAPPQPSAVAPYAAMSASGVRAAAPRGASAARAAVPPPVVARDSTRAARHQAAPAVTRSSTVVKGAHLLSPAARPAMTPVAAPSTASTPALSDAALTASIRRAFASFALPYQEDSALIVAVARQFGIDPAIPAALFMHEDGNINNRALFPDHMNWLLYYTHNPGNIKCMYQPCYEGFQVYPTYRDGILDWFRLYDHYYFDLGIHDLTRFVATYCPPDVDGNGPPSAYQSDVLAKAARIHAGWP